MDRTLPPLSLITGASSGIGLAFTRHLLANSHDRIVAVSRHADASEALADIASQYPDRVQRHAADLTDEKDLEHLHDTLQDLGGLSRVINCAGMLHRDDLTQTPEKRLENVCKENLEASFSVNAFAPILLARHTLPLMPRKTPSVFASLSARVGSISDNHLGGWYAYRAAKAAQNQLLRTLAIEARRRWPHVRILLLHPGTTDTPLSSPFQDRVPEGKLFDAPWVAKRLTEIIDGTDENDSGRFIDWRGEDIPW